MTPTEQDKELRKQLDIELSVFAKYIRYHERTGLGGPNHQGVARERILQLITADRKRVALEAHNKAVNRCREEICYHFDPNGEREPDIEAEAIDALLEHLLKAQQEDE